jgi:hypothetical protein
VERDSAGIRIVENPASALEVELAVPATPELEIGVLDGEAAYQLYQVSAAARLADGTFVVANAGSREVRFYGPDGVHRVTVGGAGQGPEEFRYPAALLVEAGDTLVVQDRLDRVRYGPGGDFLGRESADRERLQHAAGPGGFTEGGLWLPGGSLFAPVYERQTAPPVAGPPFRPRMTFLRIRPEDAVVDTLGDFGGIGQQYVDVGGTRGVAAVVPPFPVNTSWAHGARDGTLVAADSERPEFHLFRGDGTHVLVRWPALRVPLLADEVEAWKEAQRGASWTRGQLPALERAWASLDIPERKAAYGTRVSMGRDGSVWVPESDSQADPAPYLVFTPDGRLRGRATLPGPFLVLDAGDDWVLGVYRDENEVEYLRLHRVTP